MWWGLVTRVVDGVCYGRPRRTRSARRRLAACKTLGSQAAGEPRLIISATGACFTRAGLIRGLLGLNEAQVLRVEFVWPLANL